MKETELLFQLKKVVIVFSIIYVVYGNSGQREEHDSEKESFITA